MSTFLFLVVARSNLRFRGGGVRLWMGGCRRGGYRDGGIELRRGGCLATASIATVGDTVVANLLSQNRAGGVIGVTQGCCINGDLE